MNSIILWENLKNLKELKIAAKSSVQDLCISEDWAMIVTSNGVFHQTLRSSSSIPKPINLKYSITSLSCNRSMCLFLSNKGEIWVWGNDIEKYGIFGKDTLFASDIPIKMESLASHSMISMSLGASHAAAVCSSGLLYTWGTGKLGELGEISSTRSLPQPVNSANIFKSRQVICGEKYTAICTEAGFVYIYGRGKKCNKCGGAHGFPYTIDSLQNSFLEKIWSWGEAIVSLSETGKCFVIGGCKCVEILAAEDKIHQIAVCSEGIVGLGEDNNTLYMWVKRGNQWEGLMHLVKKGNVEDIRSGLGGSVGIVGNGLKLARLEEVKSRKISISDDVSMIEERRKSFDEILDSYGVKNGLENLNPRPMYKALEKCLNGVKLITFNQIKMKTYSNDVYKTIYDSMRLPIVIIRAMGRIELLLKLDSLVALKGNHENGMMEKKKDECFRCCLTSAYHMWKQAAKNTNYKKIQGAVVKIINDKLTKIFEKSKKFAFSSLHLHGIRNLARSTERLQKRHKALIKLLLITSKVQYKSYYCELSRRFKKYSLVCATANAQLLNNSNMLIDPRYKIEIIPVPQSQEIDSPPVQTSMSFSDGFISVNRSGLDSARSGHSNKEFLYQHSEPHSPSVDSTSPNSEQSPLITKLKELKSFKARVNQKLPAKSNDKLPISSRNVGNDIKRNSFTMNSAKNNLRIEIMKNSKKSMTTKESSTPLLFLKDPLASQAKKKTLGQSIIEPLHIQMRSVGEVTGPLSKALNQLVSARMSDYFVIIIKNTLKKDFVSLTPNAKSNSLSSKLFSDSWKMKLFSLGITKLNRRIDLILKKREATAYNLLKLRIV